MIRIRADSVLLALAPVVLVVGCSGGVRHPAEASPHQTQTHRLGVPFRSSPTGRVGGAGTSTTSIDVGTSLRRGETKTLYSVRGHSHEIGRFVVSCGPSGRPQSAYVVAGGADTLVAVEGRGASDAARVLSGRRLAGGTRPGLERWMLLEGTEAEE